MDNDNVNFEDNSDNCDGDDYSDMMLKTGDGGGGERRG